MKCRMFPEFADNLGSVLSNCTQVNSRDIDNAIAVMLESFIQSQKHQVGAGSQNTSLD